MREAIVLAGGFGTRLRQLVPDCPKPMAPVAGRPFLEILLCSLAKNGFSRVVLSLGFQAEKISTHFGSRFAGMDLHCVVESSPLGTGGGLRLALTQCTQDHVFIFNGDTLLDFDVETVESQWQNRNNPIIVARQVADTARYGRLHVQNDLVVAVAEKGEDGPGLINAGCYVFRTSDLDAFEINESFSLEMDFLSKAVKATPFDVFIAEGLFIDIGVPEDYQLAQKLLSER